MTFEKMLNDLTMNLIPAKQAFEEVCQKDKLKTINYYAALRNIAKEPLKDAQLQELQAIVGVLQTLYNSTMGSPIDDSTYDTLQEELIDMGIPRLTGSIEINDATKVGHKHTQLRGTLDKVYYLTPNEPRTNKSRKYLDDYLRSIARTYQERTGKKIDPNKIRIIVQPKFDGVSAVEEKEKKPIWITRGNTQSNLASDVSKIMNIFNDIYAHEPDGTGIKYEVMMTEENLARVNSLYRQVQYKNSRQIVISIFNSGEADFKADYLYPVPLRIVYPGEDIESVHPDLIRDFPTLECTFGDRELIRDFANKHHYVTHKGMRFRTDGAVMTILDKDICRVLGRDNDINNFEIAYKFTEEKAYTKVKDVEFYVSEFGYVTPVLVVNDVILKGNTVNHISLSNKERFDELGLCYGDTVKVLYDIIPYVTLDAMCKKNPNGRKIEFTKKCPMCKQPLDLSAVQVQCKNPDCPSRRIGRVLNYCANLRIKNIGWSTLQTLYDVGLLDDGILSLYKLRKKVILIEDLEGFGKLKTKKMIAEIEAKRRLKDWEFFGSLGIGGLSLKTFQLIFGEIKLQEFLDMIRLKNFDLLTAKLTAISGMGNLKAERLVEYFKEPKAQKDLNKLLREVKLFPTYGTRLAKGRICFTGCRPSEELRSFLINHGWEPTDSWSNSCKYLIIPFEGFTSGKTENATARGVPIIPLPKDTDPIDILLKKIPNLM